MSEEIAVAVEQNQEANGAVDTTTTPETTPETPKQVVHTVQNPTDEEMKVLCAGIMESFDTSVIAKSVNFNFKKSTDKETGIETIRNSVQLSIPYPSAQGIVDILQKGEDSKGFQLLMEAMETVVNSASRDLLYDDLTLNAATFPVSKVSWEFIANLPKAQRRGGGIPKEVWEAFGDDYMKVMPDATGKTMEQVGRAAKILLAKLSPVRTTPAVLQLLIEQLAIYADATESIEDFQDCVAFLLQKADTFLNVSDEDLIANL